MNDHAQEARTRLQSAHGKKILITGGTSGVGLETARQLIAAGADVTVVGSGASKGEAAERSLNEAAGTGRATFVAADLSSLAAVRRLAATMNERLDRLDVLINNAGVVSAKRVETVDGNELTFAVNYLAPFVLTNELLPLLKRSSRRGSSRSPRLSSRSADSPGATCSARDITGGCEPTRRAREPSPPTRSSWRVG